MIGHGCPRLYCRSGLKRQLVGSVLKQSVGISPVAIHRDLGYSLAMATAHLDPTSLVGWLLASQWTWMPPCPLAPALQAHSQSTLSPASSQQVFHPQPSSLFVRRPSLDQRKNRLVAQRMGAAGIARLWASHLPLTPTSIW